MIKELEDYTLKELFKFNEDIKLKAIYKLIDSIGDDKAFEVKAYYETEKEIETMKRGASNEL